MPRSAIDQHLPVVIVGWIAILGCAEPGTARACTLEWHEPGLALQLVVLLPELGHAEDVRRPERVTLAPLDEAGRLLRVALVQAEEQIGVLRPAGQRRRCFVWYFRCWVTGQYGRP